MSSSYTVNEGLPVHESNGENNSSNPTLPAVQSYEPDPLRVNVQTSNLNGGVGNKTYKSVNIPNVINKNSTFYRNLWLLGRQNKFFVDQSPRSKRFTKENCSNDSKVITNP